MVKSVLKVEKSPRGELEFARNVRDVLTSLPYQALLNFLGWLEDPSEAWLKKKPLNEKSKTSPDNVGGNRRWVKSSSGDMEFFDAASLPVEVCPSDAKSVRRFDLVVPVPPRNIGDRLVTSIVFEFKLGEHDPVQLKDYAGLAPSSLVISIAKDAPGVEPFQCDKHSPKAWWICQNWEHLYFALSNLLSADARSRVTPLDPPDNLLLGFDHMIPGQDQLTFFVEKLLYQIHERDLLNPQGLTLIVPKGKHAQLTLPAYYAHPKSWRSGYQYLVVIEGNILLDVYEVTKSMTTDRIADEPPKKPDKFDDEVWQELIRDDSLRISILKKMSAIDEKIVDVVKRKYKSNSTPSGRAASFTQGHRYLNSLDELRKYFNAPSR